MFVLCVFEGAVSVRVSTRDHTMLTEKQATQVRQAA